MDLKEGFQGIAFGLMDGLIVVLGLLIGVAAATGDTKLAIASGLLGGIANSFGNSIGFYTSEKAERGQQLEFYAEKGRVKKSDQYVHSAEDIRNSTVMTFFASVTALIIPILPLFIISDIFIAVALSFLVGIAMLFLLGTYICTLNKCRERHVHGLLYVLLGVAGAVIAFVVGELLKIYLFPMV